MDSFMDLRRPLGRGGYIFNVLITLLVCGLLGWAAFWICNTYIPQQADLKAAEEAARQAIMEEAAEEGAEVEAAEAKAQASVSEEHHNVFFEVSIFLLTVISFFGLGVLLFQCLRRLFTIGWRGLTSVLIFIPGVNILFLVLLIFPSDKTPTS